MPNPLKGEVSLSLDGREFILVLDHEALIEAEALYRKPLPQLMADATLGFAGACRALLYGALRAHHRDVTPGQATAMFVENMDDVGNALAAAAEAGFPKSEGKDDKNPPPRGTNSGASGAKPAKKPKPSSGQRRARTR